MPHVPHVLVEGPWAGSSLQLQSALSHHLKTVLRRRDGDPISYTDGEGIIGNGTLRDASIARGRETLTEPPARNVTLAVAPPKSSDRARFVVEKTAELGVARLLWLRTRHGEGRAPAAAKAAGWARSSLEQSRGAWLMEVEGPVEWDELERPLLVATPGGISWLRVAGGLGGRVTVAVGPEGGFDPAELPADARPVALSDRVLRIETAALVAAALALVPGWSKARIEPTSG